MHVAAKLRNYTNRTQSIVQHLVSGILFKADMGVYDGNVDQPQLSSTSGSWDGTTNNNGWPAFTLPQTVHSERTLAEEPSE